MNDCLYDSLTLLGRSQTFFGVIATLIILCISKKESNFMMDILGNIKKMIEGRIENLKPSLDFNTIKADANYKAIWLYANKENANDKTLQDECKNKLADLFQENMQLQLSLNDWDSGSKDFTKQVEDSHEQRMAPLFTFAYCIIIFTLDESLRCSFIPFKMEQMVFLVSISVLVFCFWFLNWSYFLFVPIKKQYGGIKKDRSIVFPVLFHAFITLIIFSFIKIANVLCNFNILPWIIVSLMVIYICWGINYLRSKCEKRNDNVVSHYVYHFIYMSCYSILVAFLFSIFFPDFLSKLKIDANDTFMMKLLLIINTLGFGFVFPFLVPFSKYNFEYVKMRIKNKKVLKQHSKKIREIESSLKTLVSKINCQD